MALAELARRGLLLPYSLPQVVPIVVKVVFYLFIDLCFFIIFFWDKKRRPFTKREKVQKRSDEALIGTREL